MMISVKDISLFLFALVSVFVNLYGNPVRIIVSKDGLGDYRTIQSAIASLSDSSSETRIIYIKKGEYREKIFIDKHNILLEGEDKDEVVISASVSREEWRCLHPDDWGVATLNINGCDITLKNITVMNVFGYEWEKEKEIVCQTDSVRPYKIITQTGHQMALRTMAATRFRAVNCSFKSYAGDTVSPWNVQEGMFYFKNCTIEGGVDMYCPRGWAYAEDCTFHVLRGSAAIWHDGSENEKSKAVFVGCSFDGYEGFQLGRFHRDAQFYLINCSFSERMADKEIFHAKSGVVLKWGYRVYYHNCHRAGGDFNWFADNLTNIRPSDINAHWVFENKWNP